MSMRHKDHRRRSAKARALAALKSEADRRAVNDVLTNLFEYGRTISRTHNVDLSTASVGKPIRLAPMPVLDLELKHVRYQLAVDQRVLNLRGIDRDFHRQEAAHRLAEHLIREGLVSETVQHLPHRGVTIMAWECFIGRERF